MPLGLCRLVSKTGMSGHLRGLCGTSYANWDVACVTYKGLSLQPNHFQVNHFTRSEDKIITRVLCVVGPSCQMAWAIWFWRAGCYKFTNCKVVGLLRITKYCF